MSDLSAAIFDAPPQVRYVAIYDGADLSLAQRPDLAGASAAETDRYEELLVNPTVLKLTSQRGNIDCGGLEYVLIRYGNFYQLVHPTENGHVSVAIDAHAELLEVVDAVRAVIGARP